MGAQQAALRVPLPVAGEEAPQLLPQKLLVIHAATPAAHGLWRTAASHS